MWRDRQTSSISLPKWGFLDQTPDQSHLPTQKRVHVHPALMTGLRGGLIYCVLLLALRLGLRLLLPESVRNADWFQLVILACYVGFAALMQAGIAMKVARKIKSFNGVHGLFASFTAGCVMTLSVLVINILFGGTINAQFSWQIFSLAVNWGALLSLLGMMVMRLPEDQTNVSDSDLGFEA